MEKPITKDEVVKLLEGATPGEWWVEQTEYGKLFHVGDYIFTETQDQTFGRLDVALAIRSKAIAEAYLEKCDECERYGEQDAYIAELKKDRENLRKVLRTVVEHFKDTVQMDSSYGPVPLEGKDAEIVQMAYDAIDGIVRHGEVR